MQRKLADYAKITLKGMAMGAADVVPGVSGGTIAFISGIYEELISTISSADFSLFTIWKQEGFKIMWGKLNGPFILSLLSGILISFFSLMRLANYLLENHPIYVWSFFFGLVLASIWYVGKQIPKWNLKVFAALFIGGAIAFYITTLPPLGANTSNIFLFFSGALAICAMILPGISGAYILVLLGAYKTVSEATHDFDFKILSIVALGAVFGLASFSRILKWLFTHYSTITLAALTGFIAGSLNKIWPWKKILETATIGDKSFTIREESVLPFNFEGDPQLLGSIGLMLLGFLLIFLLEFLATKKTANAADTDA